VSLWRGGRNSVFASKAPSRVDDRSLSGSFSDRLLQCAHPTRGVQQEDGVSGAAACIPRKYQRAGFVVQTRRLELVWKSQTRTDQPPRTSDVTHSHTRTLLALHPSQKTAHTRAGESCFRPVVLQDGAAVLQQAQRPVCALDNRAPSSIRPHCSCNEASRSVFEGRSSRRVSLAQDSTTRSAIVSLTNLAVDPSASYSDRKMSGRSLK
jgi:hypothetical protein